MTDPHTKAIEDAAKALCFTDCPDSKDPCSCAAECTHYYEFEDEVAPTIQAYLAAMKAQGWKLCPRNADEQTTTALASFYGPPLYVSDSDNRKRARLNAKEAWQRAHDAAPEPTDE